MAGPSRSGPPPRARRRTAAKPAAAPAAAAARTEAVQKAAAVPVSLESVLWLALVGIAAGLRLASLGHLPLSEQEGVRAFAAWAVSNGDVPQGWPGDLTAALTSHLFRIFGSTETVARLIPALSGTALVAAFWWARRYVGSGSALLAAAFIALSPLTMYASRTAFGFAPGALISMVMVLALLAYLDRRQPAALVTLAATFGVALAGDPVSVTTAIALTVFVVIEAGVRREGAVAQALTDARSNRDHWRPAAAALGVALLLSFVQYGTDIDRLSLPGVRLWLDVFSLPGDDLPWHYNLTVLLAYEWPLLIAGLTAYLVLVDRWFGRNDAVSLVERLLVTWCSIALAVVVFATQRQSGQLVVLLLPLSLLAAMLLNDLLARLDWRLLRRWWPAAALALALTAYAMLQLTRWAREGGGLPGDDKLLVISALLAAAFIVAGAIYQLGRNGLVLALPVAGALAAPFLLHSSLSLGFDAGTELAVDTRPTPSVRPFVAAVDRAAADAGVAVVVDPRFRDVLAWYLRHSPAVVGDPVAGAPLIAAAGEPSPPGYKPPEGAWRIAEQWTAGDFDPLPTWRWFVYRSAYGNLSTIDVQILIQQQ